MKNKYNTIETILDIITAICIVIGIVNSVWLLIWAILTLVFGCICKKIGLSKGIDYGFILGWFLGIIGLIIICVLPEETNNNIKLESNSNKYDDLERLQKLKECGAITEEEFKSEKLKLLN